MCEMLENVQPKERLERIYYYILRKIISSTALSPGFDSWTGVKCGLSCFSTLLCALGEFSNQYLVFTSTQKQTFYLICFNIICFLRN